MTPEEISRFRRKLEELVRVPSTRPVGGGDPARELEFFLGTHEPSWLTYSPVPLFVSIRRLMKYAADHDLRTQNLPRPQCSWAIDSGGFTELKMFGRWTMDEDEYATAVIDVMLRAGTPPTFVAAQDWMCEDVVIHGGTTRDGTFTGTGLSVQEHQERTVQNYVYLAREYSFVPWMPALQGQTLRDYLRHVDMYRAEGIDLADLPRVGLGSVCRREATQEIAELVDVLADLGLRLHGFGVKRGGFGLYGRRLRSADSLAWSERERWRQTWEVLQVQARRGCTHRAHKCQNCFLAALQWRDESLEALRTPQPMHRPPEPDPGNHRYAWALGGPAARRRAVIAPPATPYPKARTALITVPPAAAAQQLTLAFDP